MTRVVQIVQSEPLCDAVFVADDESSEPDTAEASFCQLEYSVERLAHAAIATSATRARGEEGWAWAQGLRRTRGAREADVSDY